MFCNKIKISIVITTTTLQAEETSMPKKHGDAEEGEIPIKYKGVHTGWNWRCGGWTVRTGYEKLVSEYK